MTAITMLSRRGFMVNTAAAIGAYSLGIHLPTPANAQSINSDPPEINAWIVVQRDETVIIRVARSEMGQGSLTGLAQLVVEELECDWSMVTTEYVTPGRNLARGEVWGDFQTGGSGSIRESHESLRQAGAAARLMLIAAAANEWGVRVEECTVAKGVITHSASGRRASYGKVAAAAAGMPFPKSITLKDPKDWTVAGQSLRRLDTADKLTGKQLYGIDVVLPGMLNAAIRACPVAGGKLSSFDAATVASMPGVRKVIQVGETAVAVVADRWWQARTAVEALPITWDEGPNTGVSSASIAEMLTDGFSATDAFAGTEAGDAAGALAQAAKTITADYSYPYQAHAAMEPINATARFTPEKCEVWVPTQNGTAALNEAAAASGLPVENCEVYKLHLGGGFGRRLYQDFVRQAVLIAKELPGTPVKLIWTREEDMTHDAYHPTTRCRLVGGLDEQGNLTGLRMRICGQSIRATWAPHRVDGNKDPHMFHGLTSETFGYSIPNLLIEFVMRNPPMTPGAWRGVHLNQNFVYLESFIDELAHAAGKDPLAFRRTLLASHPKQLAVLDAVASRVGWDTPPPANVHRGIAVAYGYASYVAAVAEVSVDAGRLKIHRIVCATDVGYAVNPELLERQAEGACTFGLSAALYGECTVDGGAISVTNFDTYEVLRLADMPAIETIVMQTGGFWGGGGEPPIAVAAPAVLNAIFAATGKRIRNLPIRNTDLGS
ncbi:molybdopterin-dependent oxidoreductase [Pararhizobium sp. BT-229]|uniref:xanthine dehydrogenase family protein molybdopterin-binding subunit n=1 Tax=Pararhizobium sp. BT-229 TaxID=2986923 RepID=UPI0021F7AEB8|nr:molybdopterin cofactor-binding domain-containing protein [Pararhizobium sp. BT-229]MCV9963308.1 molybdopterin-dependent oxidoreductase [Pararhizobium sp. BT-229]